MSDVIENSADNDVREVAAHTGFLLRTLPLGRRSRIMDVGANPSNRPLYANLAEAGHAEVHGFEPGEAAFAKLQQRKAETEVYYPFAVGNGKDATYHTCANSTFSSLFAPDPRQIATLGHWANALQVNDTAKLSTIKLDDVEDMTQPDLLKMDTQGAELDILTGGTKTLSKAVCVMSEVRFFQLYKKEPMLGHVDLKLRKMGFMLHKILPATVVRLTSSRIERLRPAMARNQMVDADAVYIRDLARHDKMSIAQICHLAVLADSVFGSVDLVLRCLDLLVARGALRDPDIDTYIEKLPRNYRVAEE